MSFYTTEVMHNLVLIKIYNIFVWKSDYDININENITMIKVHIIKMKIITRKSISTKGMSHKLLYKPCLCIDQAVDRIERYFYLFIYLYIFIESHYNTIYIQFNNNTKCVLKLADDQLLRT